MLDPLMPARIQIGIAMSVAILFASLAVALGWMLLYFALKHERTGEAGWMQAHALWSKVFGLAFALAATGGAAAAMQIETNWPGFSAIAGQMAAALLPRDLLGALFVAEIVLIGVMLAGAGRMPRRVLTAATGLAALAATALAVPFVALASWMQTPAGFRMKGATAMPTDLVAAFLNPSFPYRLAHMLIAAGLTAAFLVAGFCAFRHLAGDRSPANRLALRAGVALGAMLVPVQLLSGYLHGQNTLLYQPAKIAAIEANWVSRGHVPLVLFGWPDEETRENRWELSIPDGASLILRHEADGVVAGIDNYRGEHPPVLPVFLAFRVMVGVALLMAIVAWPAAFFLFRRDALPRPLAWALVPMAASGWVATVAGWLVAEIGRQPWLVADLARTADAAVAGWDLRTALSLGGGVLLSLVLAGIFLAALHRLATEPPARET
jgi:cytochrome d ubiquinol oxidase subunit I